MLVPLTALRCLWSFDIMVALGLDPQILVICPVCDSWGYTLRPSMHWTKVLMLRDRSANDTLGHREFISNINLPTLCLDMSQVAHLLCQLSIVDHVYLEWKLWTQFLYCAFELPLYCVSFEFDPYLNYSPTTELKQLHKQTKPFFITPTHDSPWVKPLKKQMYCCAKYMYQ